MNIENAFCVELDEVVDIYQARDFFEEKNNGHRLTFLCSFDSCRKMNVKVTGVNYDKSSNDSPTFGDYSTTKQSLEVAS